MNRLHRGGLIALAGTMVCIGAPACFGSDGPAPAPAPATAPTKEATPAPATAKSTDAGEGERAKPEAGLVQRVYTIDTHGEGWQVDREPAPGTDEEVIAQARRALAEDRPEVAIEILDAWLEKNAGGSSVVLPQAYLVRGDAVSADGDEYQALYDYEKVINSYPGSPEFVTANEREMEIAKKYADGMDRIQWGIRWWDATEEGEELLIRVQERLPGSRLAERAGIELADHYFRERELALASDAYDLFGLNYPASSYKIMAMQRRIYANVARYKGPRYDPRPLTDTRVLAKRFAATYPAQAEATGLGEALVVRIDEGSAGALYESATWYLARGDDPGARYMLGRIIKRYPRTQPADWARATLREHGWPVPGETPGVEAGTPTPANEEKTK